MKGEKTGGRTKGTPNKITQQLRLNISRFVAKNWKNVQHDFDCLKPLDKLLFLEKLMKFTVPTLTSVSTTIDFEKLTEDDLDRIIEGLLKASQKPN